jgi:hypothetical protein
MQSILAILLVVAASHGAQVEISPMGVVLTGEKGPPSAQHVRSPTSSGQVHAKENKQASESAEVGFWESAFRSLAAVDVRTPSGIAKAVILLVAALGFLVWTGAKLVEALAKLLEKWKDVGLPVTFHRRTALEIRQRRQFCRVLNSDLATLAKTENWNDIYFTDLEAEIEAEGKYYTSTLRRLLRRPSQGLRRAPSLIEALTSSAEQVLLVVGEPGSGKSVALRHLAHQMAQRGTLSSDPRALVPLYLNLKELTPGPKEGHTADSIKQFVLDNIRRGDAETAAYVREHWDDYRSRGVWFFLFDSFDEIPAVLHAPTGSAVIREHAEALRMFLAGMSACRGILASREFKGPDSLPWQKLRILPLSEARQERLVSNSFLKPEQQKLVREHLVSSDGNLLRSNPLFLTLLCRYIREEGSPPTNDHDLLKGHIIRLAHRDVDFLQRTYHLRPEDLLAGAERLAVIFAESPTLSLAPTQDEIIAALDAQESTSQQLHDLVAALVDVKIGRSDVRESRPGDLRFTFAHRRYQETLFVGYLAAHPQHLAPHDLLTNLRWREYTVTLLQTADSSVLDPLLAEAAQVLDDAARRQSSVPIVPELGGGLSYYLWDNDPLIRLLSLLQEGLTRRKRADWRLVSEAAARLLMPRWEGGDLYDRRRVLDMGGLLPAEILAACIAYAVDIRAPSLQAIAFKKVELLQEVPESLSAWVRDRLSKALLSAKRRSEERRLAALAARLPTVVGARSVYLRCSLLRKLITPLVVRLFYDEQDEDFLVLALINPLMVLLTFAFSAWKAGYFMLLALCGAATLWLATAVYLFFIRRSSPRRLAREFLSLSSRLFIRIFLIVAVVSIPVAVLYLLLASINFGDSREKRFLVAGSIVLVGALVWAVVQQRLLRSTALARLKQLRDRGFSDTVVILNAATSREVIVWAQRGNLMIREREKIRSISRLAMDPERLPPELRDGPPLFQGKGARGASLQLLWWADSCLPE